MRRDWIDASYDGDGLLERVLRAVMVVTKVVDFRLLHSGRGLDLWDTVAAPPRQCRVPGSRRETGNLHLQPIHL